MATKVHNSQGKADTVSSEVMHGLGYTPTGEQPSAPPAISMEKKTALEKLRALPNVPWLVLLEGNTGHLTCRAVAATPH